MSDDENENQPHPHFMQFFMGPTPEQVEHARMNHEANAHETRQFFMSLNADQLRKLRGLLDVCYQTEGAAALNFMGITTALLDSKFDMCLACGKNHDKELADFGSGQTIKSDKPFTEASQDSRYDPDLMKKYNMEYAENGISIRCSECKAPSVSLEDRMLRAPGKEGCETCIQKEKWG